jgi:hypothetical protein
VEGLGRAAYGPTSAAAAFLRLSEEALRARRRSRRRKTAETDRRLEDVADVDRIDGARQRAVRRGALETGNSPASEAA